MSGVEDPVAWLRRTVEARRALAEAAASVAGPEWHYDRFWPDDSLSAATTMILSAAGSPLADTLHRDDEEMAPHIAANDPQAIIADCEKDLAILDLHALTWPDGEPEYENLDEAVEDSRGGVHYVHVKGEVIPPYTCLICGYGDGGPCKTVRLVASGYRYQPGYAETWREPEDKPPADVREVSPGLWTSGPSLVELDAYGADPRKPETEGPRGCCGSWPGQPHDPEHCTAGTEGP